MEYVNRYVFLPFFFFFFLMLRPPPISPFFPSPPLSRSGDALGGRGEIVPLPRLDRPRVVHAVVPDRGDQREAPMPPDGHHRARKRPAVHLRAQVRDDGRESRAVEAKARGRRRRNAGAPRRDRRGRGGGGGARRPAGGGAAP